MLMSVDGKISTGSSDELDVDKDFPNITGVKMCIRDRYAAVSAWSFDWSPHPQSEQQA